MKHEEVRHYGDKVRVVVKTGEFQSSNLTVQVLLHTHWVTADVLNDSLDRDAAGQADTLASTLQARYATY